MLFQLIENKYKDWEEHHPPSKIEFELKERTAAGQGSARKFRRCEPSISLEVTPARRNERKDWEIYSINFIEVKQNQSTHAYIA